MRPYLITAKLMRPSNMKRFPTPGLDNCSVFRNITGAVGKGLQTQETYVAVTNHEFITLFTRAHHLTIQNQMNPVFTCTPCFFTICFNIHLKD
jgi:hypothetical protein